MQSSSHPPARRARSRRALLQLAKQSAWATMDLLVRILQLAAGLAGRTQRVGTIIYKVDRLGDWLFAEATLRAVITDAHARGDDVVVWASHETSVVRRWRPLPCPVEAVTFEPRGWRARLTRTARILSLLATYRADRLICLRHGNDPVRDFVLRTARARDVFAASWVIRSGAPDGVPHEIRRHAWLLDAAGLRPASPSALLPHLAPTRTVSPRRIVLAPFSSARIKDWPDAAWRSLIAAFAHEPFTWELWVGRDQLPAAEGLAQTLRSTGARVTTHSGSLDDLAGAIASAQLVLSVDTLAAHIAAALDRPLLGILGGGQFGDFAPWTRSRRQRWLHHPLPCFHCNWHCSRPQNDCILLITPERVIAEMKALLAAENSAPPAESRVLSAPSTA